MSLVLWGCGKLTVNHNIVFLALTTVKSFKTRQQRCYKGNHKYHQHYHALLRYHSDLLAFILVPPYPLLIHVNTLVCQCSFFFNLYLKNYLFVFSSRGGQHDNTMLFWFFLLGFLVKVCILKVPDASIIQEFGFDVWTHSVSGSWAQINATCTALQLQ